MDQTLRQLWHKLQTLDKVSHGYKNTLRCIRDAKRLADPNPIDERINWRWALNRLFHETLRRQQPSSNLHSVFSESERQVYHLAFSLNFMSRALAENEELDEVQIDEMFEDFLYGTLLEAASHGESMVPYTEKLPLRYGEVGLRREASLHDFELFKFDAVEKQYHSDYFESGRFNFFEVTNFVLIPPVPNPQELIVITYGHNLYGNMDIDDTHRWMVRAQPLCGLSLDWWCQDLRDKVSYGDCRVTFLDPPPRYEDGSPVF